MVRYIAPADVRRWIPWILLRPCLLIGILVPFFLFEKNMDALVERLTGSGARSGIVAVAVVLFSRWTFFCRSLRVSSALQRARRLIPTGTLSVAAGMTLGSILGYVCGRRGDCR